MGISMSTGYGSTLIISHVHLFCFLCILHFGDGRTLSLKQNFERPVVIYNQDGTQAYHLHFYDNGTDCRRGLQKRHKSLFAANKHTVETVLAEDGSGILNITWDVAELPRSLYRQRFQFKAKFRPYYEVVDDTKKCVFLVAKKINPSPLEHHMFYFDQLQIPAGKKGVLEITPSDSGRSETLDINSECECEGQVAHVLDRGCPRITLAFYKHPRVTYFNFTVHSLNNTDSSFSLRGQEHLNKNQTSYTTDDLYLLKPGFYSVKMQFTCSTGDTTRVCRDLNRTTYIFPCPTEPGYQTQPTKPTQPKHEKIQWVLIPAVVLTLVIVTVAVGACWFKRQAGARGVVSQRQNNGTPITSGMNITNARPQGFDEALWESNHEGDHLVDSETPDKTSCKYVET